ncbi:response regulator transcription factor [Phyllobacterium sp. BT25]|uniref:Response regulator transcription factor n=1 Tax=Phyllobacterium pellucidum TaxID=2740464 RepID=A0A849VTI4_9HYPH|nr:MULTISPECIES: response regulator transcription factor [Phyllobacterium]NTS33292.1 response regulator transcription factor [Phyllobacterium pellucidum]SFJ41003.1 DNA-binding response regulator, NarL/FixJ family, contains REC and HTH domains [Phyllobacterium sp. CL33Tsu]
MSTASIRIIIVDDHPFFRQGVAVSLSEKGFTVVGEGSSADDAVRLVNELRPDVALLDLSMPGGGLSALLTILEASPELKVVILTVSESDEDVLQALRCGAHGYVLKGVRAAGLCEIIQNVVAGERYVSPALAARILTEMRGSGAAVAPSQPVAEIADAIHSLTPREEQILTLVSNGKSNKEVAREIGLQEKTIKHHMTSILQKLQVRNRTEAALLLREARWQS